MDGTLGSQTAWMLDGSGVRITSGEELAEIVRRAARAGWPVGVHAIGDRANREALDAFEATRDEWAPRGLRQRIEHAQCLAPEDLGRFAELGVACSVQFSHAPSDRDLAERFWPDRLEGAYAFRSLLASGAVLANGSDAPIEELDPLAGIRAAVTRTIDERPGWRIDEALTVEEALHATTVAPAWLAGDERTRGKLVPGLPRRPGRPLARPGRVPAGRARVGRGRRHDGRRPLGAQPAAVGLMRDVGRDRRTAAVRLRPRGATTRARPGTPTRSTRSSSSGAASGRDEACSRSGPAPGRRRAACSSSAPTRSSRSSRIPCSPRFLATRLGERVERSRDDARGRRARGGLRPGRRRVVVPLGRRGGRPREAPRRAPARRLGRALVDGVRRREPHGPVPRRDGAARSTACRGARRAAKRRRPRSPTTPSDAHRRARAGGVRRDHAAPDRVVAHLGHRGHPRPLRELLADPRPRARAPRRDPRRDRARSPSSDFGGRVTKPLVTALYTARKPS